MRSEHIVGEAESVVSPSIVVVMVAVAESILVAIPIFGLVASLIVLWRENVYRRLARPCSIMVVFVVVVSSIA